MTDTQADTKPAAHTAAPWEQRGFTIFEAGKTGTSIAVATQHEVNARANARLIASAPDLLAALQAIVKAAPVAWQGGAWGEARVAITRATGGV